MHLYCIEFMPRNRDLGARLCRAESVPTIGTKNLANTPNYAEDKAESCRIPLLKVGLEHGFAP
jgi:hypothetical protein